MFSVSLRITCFGTTGSAWTFFRAKLRGTRSSSSKSAKSFQI